MRNKKETSAAATYRLAIKRLVRYLEKTYHFKVKFLPGVSSEIFFTTPRCIFINSKLAVASQLYVLLHEIGHLLLIRQKNYDVLYPTVNKNKTSRNARAYCIERLKEESRAWELGYQLAIRFKLLIDKKQYWKMSNDYLMTYVRECIWSV